MASRPFSYLFATPGQSRRILRAFIIALAFQPLQARAQTDASAPRLSGVLHSYSTMLSTFDPNGDPEQIKNGVDGFLANAKGYLAQESVLPMPDESTGLIRTLVSRTKAAQGVINQMREQGCLSGGDGTIKDWANEVMKGALSAQSSSRTCDVEPIHNDDSLEQFHTMLEKAMPEPRLFGGANDLDSFEKKIDFAQSVVRQATENNTNASNYIRYYMQGQEPICAQDDESCRRYATRLKSQLKPLDMPTEIAKITALEDQANTALRIELRQLDATAPSRTGLNRAQANALDAFPEYHAKLREIYELPSVKGFQNLPGSPFGTDKFLRGTVLTKNCLGPEDQLICNYQVDGGFSHTTSADDLKALPANALASIGESRAKVLAPLTTRLSDLTNPQGMAQKTVRFLESAPPPTFNPSALLSNPPDETVQRTKALNLRAESLIQDLLTQRPTEFGAALADRPSFGRHICDDLQSASSRAKNADHVEAGAEAALVVAGIAVPFIGEAGLAASPVLAAYNFYRANNQVHQYQTALDDLAERGVVGQALGQPKSLGQALEEFRRADNNASNAKLVRVLSGLGVFSSTSWALNSTAKAISAADTASVRAAFAKIVQTAGIKDPEAALAYFDHLETVAVTSSRLGTVTEIPAKSQQLTDFVNLRSAVRQVAERAAQKPIPFDE